MSKLSEKDLRDVLVHLQSITKIKEKLISEVISLVKLILVF